MDARLLSFRKLFTIVRDSQELHFAQTTLMFSTLVYFSDDFIYKIGEDLGVETISTHETNGLKFLYARYKGQQFVAFRGTTFSLWSNTKRVLNFIPKRTSKGRKAHRGFIMAFADCRRQLDLLLFNSKSVIFTGHSLGGALATLATEYYDGSAITFASPKVFFNEKVKNSLAYVGYNVNKDIVTQIPPTTFFLEWSRPIPQFLWKTKEKFLNPFGYHRVSTYINHLLEIINETHNFKA